jgi:hypothetical protein
VAIPNLLWKILEEGVPVAKLRPRGLGQASQIREILHWVVTFGSAYCEKSAAGMIQLGEHMRFVAEVLS